MIIDKIADAFAAMEGAEVTTAGCFKRIYYQDVWASFLKICPGFFTAKLFIDNYNARVPRLSGKKMPNVIGFCLDGPMTLYEENIGGIHLVPGEALISNGMPFTFVGATYGRVQVLLFFFDPYIIGTRYSKQIKVDQKFLNIDNIKLVTCSEYVKANIPALITLADEEKLRRLLLSMLLDILSSSDIYEFTRKHLIQGNFIEKSKRLVQFVLKNTERTYLASELSMMYELSVETVKLLFQSCFGCSIEEFPEKRMEPVSFLPWLLD